MKVLIADDDSMTRIALRKNLEKWGYEVAPARDGLEAWEALSEENPPRLAVLDWMMPRMEGIDICRRLQQNDDFPFIYTILLTIRKEKDDIVEALDSGAYDFLSKPVHAAELRARIAVGVRLVAAEDKLREYAEKMERIAVTDALTGAFNRRYFFKQAENEIRRAKRYDRTLSFLLLDIDHFKKVNDTHGHFAGDEALKALTESCKSSIRDCDIFARHGGEEFSMILPETDEDGAFILAERLRKVIEKMTISHEGSRFNFTVSIGVASFKSGDKTVEAVMTRADDALYEAKRKGRNRIEAG
ncbi:MAG: diguanylate cyclase [Desulfobacterales bacterium]|nr:diguanylate cyclase [Desulfobacterales bacterium]